MKFTITTPIYYVNDKPHVGHAYATIVADTFARYHRLIGDDVFFLTGTDENSQKNVEAARAAGKTNIQAYLDTQSAVWKETWKQLDISFDDFIRTTEDRHKKGVIDFFNLVREKGDIYKGTYKGLYCKGCEAFVRESDLVNGLCQFHKKTPEVIEEENYFFRCSKYRDQLLSYIEDNPDFVQPVSRRNEIINYIRDHFEDVSISREKSEWGIPLPIDSTHVMYVWFDALINYLTGIGFGWDEKLFDRYWPADVHIVGKDIIKFHCALWPAMLLSAGLPLPKRIFAHGFFTIDGERIGKSMGNAIDPLEIAQIHGLDVLRYFLLREIPFGGDGDFSFARLELRYASDLAKGIGNFVSRVLSLAEKISYSYEKNLGEHEKEAQEACKSAHAQWKQGFEAYALHDCLDAAWDLIRHGDQFIDRTKPWSLITNEKTNAIQIIGILVELVQQVSVLVYPFMPHTAEQIWERLGIKNTQIIGEHSIIGSWRSFKISHIQRGSPLFPLTR
ncbi:methionine--tRNA ligase [Candidatus Uhrbacteria bacterium]|nr:methionine--tRNA ligase [Candidatus Uhrbacteria bacterium]